MAETEDELPPELDDALLASLLASDLAAEVRSLFNEHCEAGASVATATALVLSRYGHALSSPHEGPVLVLVLCALQHRAGRLSGAFRNAGIDLIDSGEALAAFPAPTGELRKGRRQLLDQLRRVLEHAPVYDAGAEA